MNQHRWQRVKQLLDEAIASDAAERPAFLAQACDGDAELQREVESLLASHEQAGTGFLNTPAANLKSAAEAPATTRAGQRIGVYQIGEQIGHGGMGEVYRADRADGQYTKDVAIKLVRGGYDSRFVLERFRNERQILATLDHPNIARLLDGGTTDDGIPYLVMELIEGTRIDSYCDDHELSITERLKLFRQVCAAVQYAHQRLVIHRDIKPSNVLVTNEGAPKLLDFGIAKILDPTGDGAETTLARPMTPEYASPEQILGKPITTASDVYSLGVVLYQLLTGRSPYPAETRSTHELARAVCESDPGRPSTVVLKPPPARSDDQSAPLTPGQSSSLREGSPAKLRRRLAGDLDDIVLMALRKEPDRRYASVEQFSEDVRRHLEALPVVARKGSWNYRASKFVQRHKAGMAGTAIILLAVAAGVGATVREAGIARANAQRAEKRFNDVRKLANSLIFDIHDSIEYLPGATAAKKLIIQKSLEYLDSLAGEAATDTSLQRELAYAYHRIGLIQGYAYNQNLGDPRGGIVSLRKGLQIRQRIAAANPGNADDQYMVACSLRVIALVEGPSLGDTDRAIADLQTAISISEHVVAVAPNNMKAVQELAADHFRLGDIQMGKGGVSNSQNGLENHRRALPLFERVAQASPGDPSKQYPLGAACQTLGEDLVTLGEFEQGLHYMEQARQIMEPPAHDPNNVLFRRGLASSYGDTAEACLRAGRPSDALKNDTKRFQIIEPLAAADPSDVDMQARLTLARADVGYELVVLRRYDEGMKLLLQSLANARKAEHATPGIPQQEDTNAIVLLAAAAFQRAGNDTQALAFYTEALQSYSAQLARETGNVDAEIDIAMLRTKIGGLYVRQGNLDRAASELQKALAISEPRVAATSTDLDAVYTLAETDLALGNLAMSQARRLRNPQEHGRQLRRAQDLYEKSLRLRQAIAHPSFMTPNGFEVTPIQEIVRRLVDCKAGFGQRGDS